MRQRLYFIIVLIAGGSAAVAGFWLAAGFRYWIWLAGGLALYLWCKEAFTGTGWFKKKTPTEREPASFQEQPAAMPSEKFAATLPSLPKTEKEGYFELTRLCVAADKQEELIRFFETLHDFSTDDDYGTTLNYVMEYLDNRNLGFIAALDWKAGIEHLAWRLNAFLTDNFATVIPLPAVTDYEVRTSISFDGVFTDFDRLLRNHGLQMGFIDTRSNEYVMFLHKMANRQRVEQAVAKIGYPYYDTTTFR